MAIAANLVLLILEMIGLTISIRRRKWGILAYYTQLSNLTALFSAAAFLLLGSRAAGLRYLATCMLVMTFLVTLFVLVPMGGGFRKLMLSGNGLYHHTLCPLLSTASWLLWETPHRCPWGVPVAVTVVYGLIMLYLNGTGRYDGPYPFFRVRHQSRAATVGWILVLIALISLIALGVRHLGT